MREKTQNIMKMNGLYLEDFLHKNQSYCQVLPEEKKEDNLISSNLFINLYRNKL